VSFFGAFQARESSTQLIGRTETIASAKKMNRDVAKQKNVPNKWLTSDEVASEKSSTFP
jgi:hypothetical protein